VVAPTAPATCPTTPETTSVTLPTTDPKVGRDGPGDAPLAPVGGATAVGVAPADEEVELEPGAPGSPEPPDAPATSRLIRLGSVSGVIVASPRKTWESPSRNWIARDQFWTMASRLSTLWSSVALTGSREVEKPASASVVGTARCRTGVAPSA